MESYKNNLAVSASNRSEWRQWLENHSESYKSVWLIIYHKDSGMPSVYYSEAVDEALCFGWIDSTPNKRDSISYYQYFAKRNPKSNWSLVNKMKVENLLAAGLMHNRGLEMVELAKKNGSWWALDEVVQLKEPEDLLFAFSENALALTHWKQFPPSARRGILEWILNAKQAATRKKRIVKTVELAEQNKRALF